jgi:outer membrane protein, heavy metal efflux system
MPTAKQAFAQHSPFVATHVLRIAVPPAVLSMRFALAWILLAVIAGTGGAQSLTFLPKGTTRQALSVRSQLERTPVTARLPEEITASLGQATDTETTLQDLESIALTNNPTLAQAAARIQAARGRCVQAGLYPNPTIGYQGTEIGNEGKAGLQGGFIGQEIVRGNKLGLNRAVTRNEIVQMQQEFESQRQRVLNDVRIEFYNVLAAQKTLEISRELVSVGERGRTVTEDLLKAKEASEAEVLQARVEANTALIAVRNADNRLQSAWRRLAAVAGVPTMAPSRLAGNLESSRVDLGWDDSLTRLLGASPQLAAAQAGVSRARAALARAQAEPTPNFNVELGAQYDNSTQDTVANVQIGMPVPIHNRNQGAIREAQAQLRIAQAEVGRVQLDLQHRLAAAFEQYSNARQQVELYSTRILPDARASLELVETAYRAGEFNYLALLTAQRTYFQANLAYIRSLIEQRQSAVAIEGFLLTDGLREDFTSHR